YGKVLGCPYMTCGTELSTQDERIRRKMGEIYDRSSKYFESLLRDAMAEGIADVEDPTHTSQEMLGHVCGVMYQAKLKNDVEIIKRDLKPGLLRFFSTNTSWESQALDQSVKS